ncbi:hypothetical protein BDF20DRAFT_2871 [Mycotypha africana]|uniref:uncharacterized protein n=1 Tax=Mycotypha africana TaxID=64632 RepID=UPI002300C387|nr:uncharacterized protein BDF20DRAFT_2871 [Mycotypha africana]KAI8990800.1 hypothetical protein BDF20DRAFT_2871 [Mycotypha africana]
MDDANDIYKILDYPLFFTNIDWNANQTNNFDQSKLPPSYHHPAPFQRRRSSSVDLPINPLYSNSNKLFAGAGGGNNNLGNNDYFSANHATILEEPLFPTQTSNSKIGFSSTLEFPNVIQQGVQFNPNFVNNQQQPQSNNLFIEGEDGSPSLSTYSASTNNDEHMISPPLSNKSSMDSHISPTAQQQLLPHHPVQHHPFDPHVSIPPHQAQPYSQQPQSQQPQPRPLAPAPLQQQQQQQQQQQPLQPHVQPPFEESQQQQQAFTFFPELQRTSYNTFLGKQLRQHTKRRRSSSLPPAFHATSAAAVYNQQQKQQQQQQPPTQKLKNDRFHYVTINKDGNTTTSTTNALNNKPLASSAKNNSTGRKHMPVIFTKIQVTDPTPVIHTQKAVKVVDARPIAIERIPNKKHTLLQQKKTETEQSIADKKKKLDDELVHLNFEDITVAELKDMLKDRGLSCTGKKQVLVERLKEERDRVICPTAATISATEEENNGSNSGEQQQQQLIPMSTDEPAKPTARSVAAKTVGNTISASPAIRGMANMTLGSPKPNNKSLFPPIHNAEDKIKAEQSIHPSDTTKQLSNDDNATVKSGTATSTLDGYNAGVSPEEQQLQIDNMDLFDFDMFNNTFEQDQQNMHWTPTEENKIDWDRFLTGELV